MSERILARFKTKLLLLSLTFLVALPAAPLWAKPYSDAEIRSVESADEAKIREIRDQEITQLRIALGRRAAVNRRADLYYRLAEIYVEAYRMTFLLEGRAHDKRLSANQPDKFLDRTHSKVYLQAAIRACQDILNLGIRYEKLDQVYYFLAFSNAELGKKKEALAYFEQLTRKFPGSVFAGEAYRELGEAAFNEGQYRKAQSWYEIALKRATPESTPRIRHKLAWSSYRQRQYDRAVEEMKAAITAAASSGEKFLSLREEALRDMAIFMTEGGRVDEAIQYFQNVAGDKNFYPRVLERLGKQYERNVEPAKAIQVYESLLKTNPGSEVSFRVLVKLVDLDLRRSRYKDALSRLKGARVYEGGEQETRDAAQNLRAMVRRTATEHHEKYRKSGSKAELEIAELYYSAYLGQFLAKDDPRGESPEIQMYLAEVKRDLGKSREASEYYRQVVGSKDKRYAKEAGALWTASLAEAIKKSGNAAAQRKTGEPSDLEREYVEAADRMQEALGETPEGREAALRAAQVLAGYKGAQKDAVKRIRKIISQWPKTVQAGTAARLWLQLQAEAVPGPGASAAALEAAGGALEDLSDAIQEIRKNQALLAGDQEVGGGKLKAALAEQELRVRIVAISREEKDHDYAAAGKGYEAIALESSQKDFAEKAFENAMASYGKAGDAAAVERVSSAWAKRFPKSPKAMDSIRGLATTQLIQGKFEASSHFFEKLGRDVGDPSALDLAARIAEGTGDLARARALWVALIDGFPKASERWKVVLQLAESYDRAGLDSEAAKTYQLCLNGPAEFEAACGSKLGDLFQRGHNSEQARAQYRRVAGLSEKNSRATPFIAYARYRLAEMMEASGKFEPLQLPDVQLKKAISQRLAFLESLSKAYQSAVEAGGPWAIASLERLANWVMKFAEELDAISLPAGADPQAVARFRKGIESVSSPLKKKALSTWADAYAKALAVEALSPALPAVADHLADAKVANPARAQGMRGRFRLAGIAADGGADGRSTAFQKIRDRLIRNAEDAGAWVDYGNLLWGDGKPLLARIAYDRAGSLSSKAGASYAPLARNNHAVLRLSGEWEDDWLAVLEAAELFQEASRQDEFFLPAKFNRALLLNYYRLFGRAKPLWEQVAPKDPGSDSLTGLAISLQGMGEAAQAEKGFRKALDRGLSDSSLEYVYHSAARQSHEGAAGAVKCASLLDGLDSKASGVFEKRALTHLRGVCESWKSSK